MRDERGQILPLAALGIMLVMLGIAGLVVDVGHSYWAKRQLQAATDAAALAAAQELPDDATVRSLASEYGPLGAKNPIRGVTNVTSVTTTRCLARTPGCAAPNSVVVQASAVVNTTFARLFGINSMTVRASATACSPCGTRTKPLDVMFVIDRTGSMCQTHTGGNDPACTDLTNARAGMEAFLKLMNPATDHVGLALFPPAPSVAGRCNSPVAYGSGEYIVSPLPTATNGIRSDFLLPNGDLNTASSLVQTIRCIKGAGATSYSAALGAAALELSNNGRRTAEVPNLEKVIIFMSDGAANTWSQSLLDSYMYSDRPCYQGVYVSNLIEQYLGYPIYSIGYDVGASDDGSERCKNPFTGNNESPSISAYSALQQIASSPDKFFLANQLTQQQMRSIFSSIAADTKKGSSSLVSDDA